MNKPDTDFLWDYLLNNDYCRGCTKSSAEDCDSCVHRAFMDGVATLIFAYDLIVKGDEVIE